jgi:hypothetical protein
VRAVLATPLVVTLLLAAPEPAAAQESVPRDAAVPRGDSTPDADSIIARAIARRRAVLAGIHHMAFDAYVKFVARDPSQPQDSSRSVLFISETKSTAWWEHHGRYQEDVLARRATRGLEAPRSLVAVDGILDLDRGTIGLAPYAAVVPARRSDRGGFGRGHASGSKYAILSPLACSAPDRYAYRVLDTVEVDGRRAIRLAVVPRSSAEPLFEGTVTVADSGYDLLAMDLGVNDAVEFTSVRNLRFEERLKDAGNGRWMPYRIRLTGEVRPRITMPLLPRQVAGVPVPGLPEQLGFEQLASLGGFAFDQGSAPAGVGEYRVVVREGADEPDSAAWVGAPSLPLTAAEQVAWARADSAGRHPPFLLRVGQGVGAAFAVAASPGFFHFNRVDGYYLGAARDWRAGPDLAFTTRLGYGFGSELWQYRFGSRVRLSGDQRLWIGGWYHDETMVHPTLVSTQYNPTFRALFARTDPLDYYRERGLGVSLAMKLWDLTRLDLSYDDARQSSLDTLTGHAFRAGHYPARGNLPAADGHLRSVSATVTFDSRHYLRHAGQDFRLNAPSWTRVAAGMEVAAPSVIPNDFSYRRYTLAVERAQPVPGMGTTTVSAAGGIATGIVPPQRYFTVDYGMEFLAVEGSGFSTLNGTNYYGNRAAVVTLRHEFGRLLFARSGLPVIRALPFTLTLHGGAFWTAFVNHAPYPADTALARAATPYTEAGFSLGNLTPFLSPFNLSVHFAWQLSSYPTRRFRFGFGITGP